MAENKVTYGVEALEAKVLGALDRVQSKLAEQNRTMSKLALPVPALRSESQWTKVVKRSNDGPPKPLKMHKATDSRNEVRKQETSKSLHSRV